MKQAIERTNNLIALSEVACPAIDTRAGRQENARLFLRMGMQALADIVEGAYGEGLAVGEHIQSLLWNRLERGGMDAYTALQPWPEYVQHMSLLPRPVTKFFISDQRIDNLAQAYADVRRATITPSNEFETNARHVMHLNVLSLPYSARVYPELDLSRIAIYNLVHDVVEAYAGDTPSLGITAQEKLAKDEREKQALERILLEFGVSHPKFTRLIIKREHLEDDEANYSKTFDKLDPKFPTIAGKGASLRSNVISITKDRYVETNTKDALAMRMSYGKFYPEVVDDFVELSNRATRCSWPQD